MRSAIEQLHVDGERVADRVADECQETTVVEALIVVSCQIVLGDNVVVSHQVV